MSDVSLSLPETANLEAATALAAELKAAGPSQPINIDVAAVKAMSTPVALTLVSAIRSRDEDAPAIKIENASSVFMDAFSDLGLFSDLMKMEFST